MAFVLFGVEAIEANQRFHVGLNLQLEVRVLDVAQHLQLGALLAVQAFEPDFV